MCNHLTREEDEVIFDINGNLGENHKLNVERQKFEKIRAEWDKKLASEYRAIEESQRIRGEDMQIIVY